MSQTTSYKKAKELSENITQLFSPFICFILFISGKNTQIFKSLP